MKIVQQDMFAYERESIAIERIKKFKIIADSMGLDVAIGFSGGKDSQVTYDLCLRAGIAFKAYFNQSFESNITLKFIKEYYPSVILRREHKIGFISNITKNHGGLLPTVQMAYCCADYKHNKKYVDACSITGVRSAESFNRKGRTAISFKNKTVKKKNAEMVSEYFVENCQSVGTSSTIQLMPIVDWSENDVWEYLYEHGLPINPEYKQAKRVGCLVCPKANFTQNAKALIQHPKLIDAFIKARERGPLHIDWYIFNEKKDCENDKVYYICRWLNHSYMPFTKKHELLYVQVRNAYDLLNDDLC